VVFRALADGWGVSGGDIKNAVLKPAPAAAAEKGRDRAKAIAQRHFVAGIESVVAAKKAMRQTVFEPASPRRIDALLDELREEPGARPGPRRGFRSPLAIALALVAAAAAGWMVAAFHLIR
ncbi:MAG TPA: hypothetical protein VFL12_00155, partial [Thermoanaerobaculia bacterium]|nr:hypothetical protein [Thermoanaerobaculia bacterium]